MNTQIFEYKGYVGISGGDLINDPSQPGQLGCLCEISKVDITQSAFDVLIKIRKGRDAIGAVMCFDNTFGWMGGTKYMLNEYSEADRDYNPALLKPRITEIEIPQDFKEAIDTF